MTGAAQPPDVAGAGPALLVLDFDGVICDGMAEFFESSWRAWERVGRAPLPPDRREELRGRFAALRPVVESGWEMALLPALLGLLGDGVNRLRIPFFGRKSFEDTNPEGRFWGAIIRRVLRRPGLSFALSTAFLLLLAAPVLGMKIGTNGAVSPAVDADGWFHTGDMGVLDAHGFLRLIGRYKDMLKVGGENVDPLEIEAYLLGHPGVVQVKVVGVPDRRLGEVVAVCVVPTTDGAPTADDLVAFCRGAIAGFKVPRHVLFVREYPMTASGKVQRFALRERVLEALGVAAPER